MIEDAATFQYLIKAGIPADLPEYHGRDESIQHAPIRNINVLSPEERRLALANALSFGVRSMSVPNPMIVTPGLTKFD